MTGSYASARGAAAAAAAPTEDTASPDQPEAETWSERVFAAIPLFAVGGACLAITIDLYFTANVTLFGQRASTHLQPWVLFLALAVIGLGAGVFTVFFEEESAPGPGSPPETVAPPVPESPRVAAEWDESNLAPEPPLLLPRRLWELDPFTSEERRAPTPSDDTVMHQLDEIEESLRKKARPPS